MHNYLRPAQIQCPYCGEGLEILIDCSAGNQHYIEDCQICCAPIEIAVEVTESGQLAAMHCKRDTD